MRKLFPISLIFILVCIAIVFIAIPLLAVQNYGQPASWLTYSQRVRYSAELLWHHNELTRPLNANGLVQLFSVAPGETVTSISDHLQVVGLIRDAKTFRAYLIYSGMDTSTQAGEYKLSPAMTALAIAHELQDATTEDVKFVILPGWRMEEIAASLPTSGLSITPEEFSAAVNSPRAGYEFLFGADSTEGFLYPDTYTFLREATADEMVNEFIRRFASNLSSDLIQGFETQGLTVYEAVTLASIVEREAIHLEEAPMIASVYLNRLNIGMNLEADPTVQYAVGFNSEQNTWWTNPLSVADLLYDSPFNTYLYGGLPPTPISNPGLEALSAVAFPADTPYYFFRANCDGSGYHVFAETFDEHVANGCQ